jgi:hypothetical protein
MTFKIRSQLIREDSGLPEDQTESKENETKFEKWRDNTPILMKAKELVPTPAGVEQSTTPGLWK